MVRLVPARGRNRDVGRHEGQHQNGHHTEAKGQSPSQQRYGSAFSLFWIKGWVMHYFDSILPCHFKRKYPFSSSILLDGVMHKDFVQCGGQHWQSRLKKLTRFFSTPEASERSFHKGWIDVPRNQHQVFFLPSPWP